ncbi:uncharacterized protein [Apostichopus japonicus]|uniref:uncharacterized protein n=1 Tax=Stichopus japonicus TaxID=307972 RepID=UPI003AB5AE5C
MASPCAHCGGASSSTSCIELLQQNGDSKILGSIRKVSEKIIHYDFGAGHKEHLSFDDANERYMTRHFPQSDEPAVHACPPVYEYVHPGEPTDIIEDSNPKKKVQYLNFNYDTLQRERMGEVAEEIVLRMFLKMFEKHKISAFIVHGYNWKTSYLKKLLALQPSLSKSFKKLGINEGEIDLLISIPQKCLIVVEVKAINHKNNFTNVVRKAFAQCGKTSKFLSSVASDLYGNKNIWLLKVVALPSGCRDTLTEFNYCRVCSRHIITEKDLNTANTLHEWYKTLIDLHKTELDDSLFDYLLHKSLIERLIGTASLMEVKPAKDEKTPERPQKESRTVAESIQWTVHQITEEHGTAAKIMSRSLWYQLTPEQLAVDFKDPKLLWLSGQPASGKTVLALWKIDNILETCNNEPLPRSGVEVNTSTALTDIAVSPSGADAAVESPAADCTLKASSADCMGTSSTAGCSAEIPFGSVVYIFAGMTSTCLSQVLEGKYHNRETTGCKVVVTSLRKFFLSENAKTTSSFHTLEELPVLISVLLAKHKNEIIHIFIDESPFLLEGLNHDKFEEEWRTIFDSERLGYVWCIQSTYYNELDSGTKAPSNFHMMHLTCVMRLTRQNIELANLLLKDINIDNKFINKPFRSGHAVAGTCPVMYRIKCVCEWPKDSFICKDCYDKRITLLLQHVLKDFQLNTQLASLPKGQFGIRDAVLICMELKKVADLLGHIPTEIHFAVERNTVPGKNCITVCEINTFRGCERSLVIVDFQHAACDDFKMKEALTRALGQYVILDCGTFIHDCYEEQIKKLKSAEEKGMIKIKEIERSPEELSKLNSTIIRHATNRGKTSMDLTKY